MKILIILSAFIIMAQAQEIPEIYREAVANGAEYSVLKKSYLQLSSIKMPGAEFPWEFIERTKGKKGAAFVIMKTTKNQLVLIKQFRPPVQREVLGLPAGMISDKNENESAKTAAVREIQEETGYVITENELIHLNTSPSSAGLTNELHHLFILSTPVALKAEIDLDEAEKKNRLQQVLIGLDEIESVLERFKAEGIYIDNKIYQALYHLSSQ